MVDQISIDPEDVVKKIRQHNEKSVRDALARQASNRNSYGHNNHYQYRDVCYYAKEATVSLVGSDVTIMQEIQDLDKFVVERPAKKWKKTYNTIICSFGYAEDESIAVIPFVYEGELTFTTWSAAIKSLAKCLFNFFNPNAQERKCCKAWKNENFCAVCGTSTFRDDGMELFQDSLRAFPEMKAHQIFDEDCNSWSMFPVISKIDFKKAIVLKSAERFLVAAMKKDKYLLLNLIKEQKEEPS